MPETIESSKQQPLEFDRVQGRISLAGGDEPLNKVIVSIHDFDPYRLLVGQENTPFSGPPWERLRASFEPSGVLFASATAVAEMFLGQFLGQINAESPLLSLSDILGPPTIVAGADGVPDPVDPLEAFLDPFWMLGERLGSVQPDETGRFELKYQPHKYRRGDPSSRPDLLIAVLAPATAIPTAIFARSTPTMVSAEQGTVELPITGSPFNRLLGLTFAGRANVGPEETYLIRINRDLAAQHDVAPPGTVVSEPNEQITPEERIKIKLEERRRQMELDEVRSLGLLELRRPEIERARSRIENARKTVQSLSALPEPMRANPLFVPDIGTPIEKKSRYAEALVALAEDSADRYSARPVDVGIELEMPILEGILGHIDLSGATFTISLDTVCRLIHEAGGGHSLVRKRSIEEVESGLAAWAEVRDEDPEPDPPIGPDPGPTGPPLTGTIEERIKEKVEALVSDMSMGPTKTTDIERTPASILLADLEANAVPKGPADTTAYRDIQTLQIAYANVWEEALSGTAEDLIADIHSEVDLLADFTLEATGISRRLSSMEAADIKYWTTGIVDELLVGEATAQVMSPAAYLLWPEGRAIWSRLSPSVKEKLNSIAERPITTENPSWTPSTWVATDQVSHEALYRALPPGTVLETDSFGRTHDIRIGHIPILGTSQVLEQINDRYLQGASLLTSPLAALGESSDEETATTYGPRTRLLQLVEELNKLLEASYSFNYFKPGSYNFGIITTNRQKVVPGEYQVGDLVDTAPMAPGAITKINVTETTSISQTEEESRNSFLRRSGEYSSNRNIASELIARAENQNKFEHRAEGGFNIGVGNFRSTANFSIDQKTFSQDTKKKNLEDMVKGGHEYRNDHTLKVNTTTNSETVSNRSIELRNPNNELTVTYLLYELERQYQVSEKLHSLTPVIMIANEMPAPDAITEAWMIKHEPEIREHILQENIFPDDGVLQADLLQALDSLTDGFVSDELSLGILKTNWKTQTSVVTQLKNDHSEFVEARRNLEKKVIGAKRTKALAEAADDSTGFLFDLGEALSGIDFGGVAVDKAAAAVEAYEQQLANVQREVDQIAAQLNNAQTALNSATNELTEALKSQSQQRVNIDQLKIYIKRDIFGVMHRVWSRENPHERYMRLHMEEVIVPQTGTATARVRITPEADHDWMGGRRIGGLVIESMDPPLWRPDSDLDRKPLHSVADLDRLLGFKGNYSIFPLKECSLITDYMMIEYVDAYFGIRDPDSLGDHTTDELIKYRKSADLTDSQKTALNAVITKRLQENIQDDDKVIVPTGQLYMEALVGSHTLLEPFKLAHRAYDALAARQELIKTGLENCRYGLRLTTEDPDYGDPDVDKLVEKRTVTDGSS